MQASLAARRYGLGALLLRKEQHFIVWLGTPSQNQQKLALTCADVLAEAGYRGAC
jgi:hypothetical protein